MIIYSHTSKACNAPPGTQTYSLLGKSLPAADATPSGWLYIDEMIH